uniref:Uncharacterized protein n=1 Tax=Periophthalmus magnuspinnatus TaxID=409849 RepID=A0A3B3ZTA3_9GOBI
MPQSPVHNSPYHSGVFHHWHLYCEWWSMGHTCIHIIRPPAGLRAAACCGGPARVEHIIHRTLHLTVINGLTLVGAEITHTDNEFEVTLHTETKIAFTNRTLYFILYLCFNHPSTDILTGL